MSEDVSAQRSDFLSFSPPDIGEDEVAAVVETLQSDWITTGPRTKMFEMAFADFVKVPNALALNSCTAGLHLALAALDIGSGDEVITTPMTFCSTINVIEHVGAHPVLVDIDPETLNINPQHIKNAITDQTKAILPVHYSGHPVEMTAVLDLAQSNALYVIEDAAHAIAATYRGQKIGSIGDFAAFSFYATKNLTTAEGGMLTGRDPELLDKARNLALHGINRDAWKRYGKGASWYYEVVAPGFKYNMTDIQAALGLVQLRRLAAMQNRRRAVAEQYTAAFSEIAALQAPVEREHVQHAWHLYVLRLNLNQMTIDRFRFIEEMQKRNIGTSVHFIPIHLHPYYRDTYGYLPSDYPVAYHEFQRMVSLPLHSGLTDEDVRDVIMAVKDIVKRHSK